LTSIHENTAIMLYSFLLSPLFYLLKLSASPPFRMEERVRVISTHSATLLSTGGPRILWKSN